MFVQVQTSTVGTAIIFNYSTKDGNVGMLHKPFTTVNKYIRKLSFGLNIFI